MSVWLSEESREALIAPWKLVEEGEARYGVAEVEEGGGNLWLWCYRLGRRGDESQGLTLGLFKMGREFIRGGGVG